MSETEKKPSPPTPSPTPPQDLTPPSPPEEHVPRDANPQRKKAGAFLQKKSTPLSQEDKEAILSLLAEYEKPLDRPVEEVLEEAREIEALLEKHGRVLYKKTLLDKKSSSSIPARRRLLARAEKQWNAYKSSLLPKKLRKLYKEAEALKQNGVAALRYFLQRNAEVQKQVDSIQIGAGLPELCIDLRLLSMLLGQHALSLKKANLPKKAAAQALTLAETLEKVELTEEERKESKELKVLRDCVFWWLREAMEEVHAAGRYAFRNRPRLLWRFRPPPMRLAISPPPEKTSPEPLAAAFEGEPVSGAFLTE